MNSNLTISINADVLKQARNKLAGKLSKVCENALIAAMKKR